MIKDTEKNAKLIDTRRFYKANEEIDMRFYQMPKVLFSNPKYRGLSPGAKTLYSILRDRQELSISNNLKDKDKWVDEDGNIYLLFAMEPKKGDNRTIEEKPMRDLSLTEILNVTKNTVTKYKKALVKYDLIFTKKMGLGNVDRIYVLKPELQPINVEIYKTPKNRDSKISNTVNLESQKLTGNDTDLNDTNFIDTQSVSRKNSKADQNKDGQTEFVNIRAYFNDKIKFNDLRISNPTNKEIVDEIEINIIEMYFADYVVIQGNKRSQELIRSAIMKLTYWHAIAIINKYLEVSSSTRVNNPKSYMQSMLYNIAFEHELAIKNELKNKGMI